jgi:adenylate kinase family enzyme
MPEPLPLVLIVTGPPASGKTTLAGRLATVLGLPLLCKDTVK